MLSGYPRACTRAQGVKQMDVPDWPCSTFPDSPEGVALAMFFWIVSAERNLPSGETPREYAMNLFRQCVSIVRGSQPRLTLDELLEERLH